MLYDKELFFMNLPSPLKIIEFFALICNAIHLALISANGKVICHRMGKLSSVSVERRVESTKFRFCWLIFGEAVPISMELDIV